MSARNPFPEGGEPDRPARVFGLPNAVADALLTQAFLCRRGICRRRRCCSLSDADGTPACLARAGEEIVAEYRAILTLLYRFCEVLKPGLLETWVGSLARGDLGHRQRICLDIYAARLPPGHPLRAEFHAFWRRQRDWEAAHPEAA